MSDTLSTVFLVFTTATVVQNLVFARGISADDILEKSKTIENIIKYGIGTLIITFPAVILMWAIKFLFQDSATYFNFEGILSVISVSISFFSIRFLTLRSKKKINILLDDTFLLSATYNCASLAIVMLSADFNKTFLETTVYCIGGVFGMSVAMLLIHSGRERLEISGVPKSFQGLSIIFIYIGILSLAIYGLIGHQLPS